MLISPIGGLLAAPPEGYRFLSYGEAMREATEEHKPLFLYFGRYGCSTCRKMHAEVFSDSELRQDYNRNFVLAYVDTESGDRLTLPNGERMTEMQFAARSRIIGTPTFVFFDEKQEPLIKTAGFKSIERMKALNEYILGGHHDTMPLEVFLKR